MVSKRHDIVLINSYARGSKVGRLTWAQKLTNPSTVYLSYYPCFILGKLVNNEVPDPTYDYSSGQSLQAFVLFCLFCFRDRSPYVALAGLELYLASDS